MKSLVIKFIITFTILLGCIANSNAQNEQQVNSKRVVNGQPIISHGSTNQQGAQKFSIFIIHEIDDPQDRVDIDTHMRAQNGMFMSRTDFHTKRYYAIYDVGVGIDEQWFIDQLAPMGYTVSCYVEGTRGVDEFVPLTHESCPNQ